MQICRRLSRPARAVAALVCLAALAVPAETPSARPIDPPGLWARTHHAIAHRPASAPSC